MKSRKEACIPKDQMEQKEQGGPHLSDREGHERQEEVEKMAMVQTGVAEKKATGYWETFDLLEPEQRAAEPELSQPSPRTPDQQPQKAMTPFERQIRQRCQNIGMVDRELTEWMKEF